MKHNLKLRIYEYVYIWMLLKAKLQSKSQFESIVGFDTMVDLVFWPVLSIHFRNGRKALRKYYRIQAPQRTKLKYRSDSS